MYVSRLTFHTQPGKTHPVERELQKLRAMISNVRGLRPQVLRNHLASADVYGKPIQERQEDA